MLDPSKRALLGGLYRMHGKMLFYSATWGFLAGLIVLITCRQGDFIFAKGALLCIGVGVLSWLVSMATPILFQVHKYLLPIALPILGAALYGIVGMIGGYAIAFVLRIIVDIRRFVFMVMATGQGPDPTQYKPVRDIVIRPTFAAAVACIAIAFTLPRFGVGWASPGNGEFALIIDPSSTGKLAQLPVFCLIWNFTRQLFESGTDVWTTPAF